MQLPFTLEQFFGIFTDYNTTVWPMQILLHALTVAALVLAAVPRRWSGRVISAILALFWAWLGLAYHLAFFAAINPLAYAFATLSVIGALVFLWQGVIRQRLTYQFSRHVNSSVGIVLILFALIGYPIWSVMAGHPYPELPTFGLPCSTTIFTIGILALLVKPHPRSPLIVPVIWAFIGGQAAFLLGVPPDFGLLVAGVVGILLIARARVKPC